MNRQQWCSALFESIDAKRTRDFLAFLTADARFRFGGMPPAEGEAAVERALEAFFGGVASLSHRVHDLWDTSGHVICRGEVHYVRRDGKSVNTPFCNVFTMRGDKIACYDVYLDPTSLTAP